MTEMTPARIVATLALAIAALAAGYLLIVWLACRAIDDLGAIWHHDHTRRRVTYIARCSTVPDMTRFEVAAIVGVVLVLGAIAVLSSTWMGQEIVEYVARVLGARTI